MAKPRRAGAPRTRKPLVAASWPRPSSCFSRRDSTTRPPGRLQESGHRRGHGVQLLSDQEDIALHFFGMEVDHAIAAVRADKRLRKAPLDEKLFALVQQQLEFLAPYEKFIAPRWCRPCGRDRDSVCSPIRWKRPQARYLAFVEQLIDEARPSKSAWPLTEWAPRAFWLFYLAVISVLAPRHVDRQTAHARVPRVGRSRSASV